MGSETILLTNKQISELITPDEVAEIVDEVFCCHGNGRVAFPSKISLDMKGFGVDSWINAMPAYLEFIDIAGIKWAGGFGENKNNALPYITSMILLNDPHSGRPLAVMEGTLISNLRTGSAAALAAKYTANKESKVCAFIGAGVQALEVLKFLPLYFNITEVHVMDINIDNMNKFVQKVSDDLDIAIVSSTDIKKTVEQADIVYTATDADEPLISNQWLKVGVTVISLGSFQEIDEDFVLNAEKIIVDDIDQCLHRGELKKLFDKGLINSDSIFAELGEIACRAKPGREDSNERILVIPIGLGAHDIAIAYRIYKKALINKNYQSIVFNDFY